MCIHVRQLLGRKTQDRVIKLYDRLNVSWVCPLILAYWQETAEEIMKIYRVEVDCTLWSGLNPRHIYGTGYMCL